MREALWFVAGFLAAWGIRTMIELAFAKIAMRIISSAIGKRAVLEAMEKAHAKLVADSGKGGAA